MSHFLTRIDHPVIAVRDMAAARVAYERLGFIVPPAGEHPAWGTGNWCIQFAHDYLELRGFMRPSAAPQTRELLAFLDRREGHMGVAFGTRGAALSHDSFVAAGLHPRAVQPLTRNFLLPGETVPVSFSLCFLPRDETPGLMHVVVCEHLTPERLRRPEWLEHPNGARGIAGLVAMSTAPEAAAAAWEKLFGNVRHLPGGIVAEVGSHCLQLLTPDAVRARYPHSPLPDAAESPAIVSIVLQCADPEQTRRWLRERGVGGPADGPVVCDPAAACGALLEFSA